MQFSTIFFDLDDTLYPASTGLWQAIKSRMNDYMHERVGIPLADIPELRERYYQQYGTTLRGLEANHHVDVADFLAYVHTIPLNEFLTPDPRQCSVFASLDTRNYIFTNADRAHAARVLTTLQLELYFESIIDVNAMAPYCKPMPESLEIALRLAGESEPANCMLIDDLPRTTLAAKNYGIFAVLFGSTDSGANADACLMDWSGLPDLAKITR